MIRRQNRMKTSAVEAALEIIRKQGRNGDTELAHVNPREKAILKALGGAGTRNPRTGLLQYEVSGGNDSQGSSGNGDFGGSMGGYLESASAGPPSPSTDNDSEMAGSDALEDALNTDRAPPPTAPPNPLQTGMAKLGEVLTDPDAIPGFGIVGNLLGRAMSSLNREARVAGWDVIDPGGPRPAQGGVPERTAEQAAREQAEFNASLPGMNAMGDSLAASMGAVPVANPTPRYLRGGEMAPPQEISSFIGPGMSDIQQRALISTYGTQGVNSAFRTDPVRRYYANLLSRGLISDAGAPVSNPYILPIEQQYASAVLGRPISNPADATSAYESIRAFL
jgi:hypothetical protein